MLFDHKIHLTLSVKGFMINVMLVQIINNSCSIN